MADDPSGARSELRHFLDVLRTQWPSIAIIVAMVVAAALYYTVRQEGIYRSETRVLLRSPLASPSLNPNQLFNMETEAAVAASPAVAEIALRDSAVDADDETVLLGGLQVETGGTQILSFSYTGPDPAEARDRVRALAGAYLQYRLDQIEAAVEPLQDEFVDVQEELEQVRDEMGETDNPRRLAQLQSRAQHLGSLLVSLEERLGRGLPGALTTASVGDIIQPATFPTERSGPNIRRNLLLALVVGLLLGVGVAMLRETIEDRVRDVAEMEHLVGGIVLGVIPRPPGPRWRRPSRLVTLDQPDSAAAQAYGALRTAIQFAAAERRKVILVTSASYGEGKTATAANLGVALAQSGSQVLLVSADLRRPALESFFNPDASSGRLGALRSGGGAKARTKDQLYAEAKRRGIQGRSKMSKAQLQRAVASNRAGLTSLLHGEDSFEEVVIETGVRGLSLLPAGPSTPNPSIVLGSDRVARLLDDMKLRADVILIDAPPVLPVPDSTILVPHSDMVLLVAEASATPGRSIAEAAHQLNSVRQSSIAGVLIGINRRWSGTQRSRSLDRSAFEAMDGSANGGSAVSSTRSA
jgi:Mrp family chromosome partitioning ATPase/capsular polysaccharide biosynthesis protein